MRGTTRYADLEERRRRLEQEREAAEVTAADLEPRDELAQIDDAMSDPAIVAEHVLAGRREIERERDAMQRERRPLERAVASAAEKLQEAEDALERLAYSQRGREEQLRRSEQALSQLQERHAPDSDDQDAEAVDPERVAELLAELRAGTLRTYIEGMDPALDAAFVLYEAEVQEIASWGAQARVDGRISGRVAAAPECAQHYTRARLQELSERSPQRASGGLSGQAIGSRTRGGKRAPEPVGVKRRRLKL